MTAFAAFQHRDLRLLWVGHLFASVGNWQQQLGLGWLVVELAVRDGHPELGPFYIGLVALTRAVPSILGGIVSGVFADRMDRRQLLMFAQGAAGAFAAMLALVVLTDRVNLAVVLLLSTLFSVAAAFDLPTRQALLPALVPPERLLSAVGLNAAAAQASQFIGPLSGGLLIVPFGIGGLFVANALAHVVIVGALALMHVRTEAIATERRASMVESIRDGLAYIRRDSVILSFVVVNLASALTARGYAQLLPSVAHDTLGVGPVELSWLLAACGIGSVAGALATASLPFSAPRDLVFLGGCLAGGALLFVFSLQADLIATLVLLGVASFAISLTLNILLAMLQSRAVNEYRGRVIGLALTASNSVGPLGVMVQGTLGTVIGVEHAIGYGGLAMSVIALAALLGVPELRGYRQTVSSHARA